ncbi:hypothetical protein BH11MYX2_BH11MYX2_26280 [soil metagenome]
MLSLRVMWRPFIVVALMATVAAADPTVTIRTAKDNSHTATVPESKQLEAVMRHKIEGLVARNPVKLDSNRNVDASIVSMTTDVVAGTVVVNATLEVIVSDDDGRITSMLGGSAKVEGKGRIADLRQDAVEGALESGYARGKDRLRGK